MLTRIDRIQTIVADRASVAERYQLLLGARIVRQDSVRTLAARRTVLRLGASEVELLEPDGAGPAADFLGETGGGLFAAGVATSDLDGLEAHLTRCGVALEKEARQIFLSPRALGIPGLRIVATAEAASEPVGLVDFLYEVSHLTHCAEDSARAIARLFDLGEDNFAPITSAEFGYAGILTLFDRARLDRLETITPSDGGKTMGRFFARRGPSLYMCFTEATDTAAVRAQLIEHAPDGWTGPREVEQPDVLFIHPKALGGTMIGVSRKTVAWTWSGQPERVEETRST